MVLLTRFKIVARHRLLDVLVEVNIFEVEVVVEFSSLQDDRGGQLHKILVLLFRVHREFLPTQNTEKHGVTLEILFLGKIFYVVQVFIIEVVEVYIFTQGFAWPRRERKHGTHVGRRTKDNPKWPTVLAVNGTHCWQPEKEDSLLRNAYRQWNAWSSYLVFFLL